MVALKHLKALIELHLNNAQASLKAGDEDLAQSGLSSATYVIAACDVAQEMDLADGEHDYFNRLKSRAITLQKGYWLDFRLTKREGAAPPPVTIKHIDAHKPRRTLTPQQKAEARQMAENRPEDRSKSDWYQEVATAWEVSPSTIWGLFTPVKDKHDNA